LKTERWGSPFVEEGSTGEKRPVTRDNNNKIIIIIRRKLNAVYTSIISLVLDVTRIIEKKLYIDMTQSSPWSIYSNAESRNV
jgi:hypothetical protein